MASSARGLGNGAGGKMCTKGKSCGATCIDAREWCELELGPQFQSALPKVREVIQRARSVAENYDTLDTPEKAVAWLDKRKEDMAGWGLTETQINNLVETRPKFITMGVEPSGFTNDSDLIRGVDKVGTRADSPYRDKGKGDFGDLLFKANTYKLTHDITQALYDMDPSDYPKNPTDLSRILTSYGANTREVIKALADKGMITPEGGLKLEGNYSADKLSFEKGIDWAAINRAMANAVAPGEQWGRANPSGLWKPSQDYEQFAPLYKAVGKDPGPFKNNASWYKYVDQQQGQMLERAVKEAKPHVMYVGASGNKDAEQRIKGLARESGTFVVQAKKKDGSGDVAPKPFRYYLVPHSDGTRSAVIFGGHPGGRAFSMSLNLANAVGEIGKSLHESGVLPSSLKNAKIVEQGRVTAESPKPMVKSPAKNVKETRKELVGGGKQQVTKTASDKQAAQRQAFQGMVNMWAGQGKSVAWIRDQLRGMKVPPAMINELV